MALNIDSVFRIGLHPTNNIVNALLNDGWRFLEAAANTPPPTIPLPNTPETITYVFDATWDFPTNLVRQTNQMDAVSHAFAAWANVANITPQLGPASNVPNFTANAEIVLDLTLGSNILNFGGYSGTAGEATQTTTAGSSAFVVADHGLVHTYIATDGFQRGIPGNAELIFDPTTGAVSPGGMQLIIHEIGHALGLKHPHDDGADNTPNLTDTNIFLPGVPEDQPNNPGPPNNLNVTVNTLMSYDNAITTLAGPINNIAVSSTPMALDIAAIQYLYGANTGSHTGNDTYVLTDTSWSCIWDAGGTDEIVYNGSVDAVINLNPATLDDSPTGGGSPSYLKSTTTTGPTGATNWATGGFTIAGDITNALPDQPEITGVIIENARGGGGNDEITGNSADNKLYGNGGADTLDGGDGNDYLDGGPGDDILIGRAGDDILFGGPGADQIGGGSEAEQFDHYDIAIFASAVTINLHDPNLNTGEAQGDFYISIEQFNGSPDSDTMVASDLQGARFAGGDGADFLYGGHEADWLQGGKGADYLSGGEGSDTASYADAPSGITVDLNFNNGITDGKVSAGDWGSDTLVSIENIEGTKFADYMVGDERQNTFFGLGGDDYLEGGAENDTLIGGTGADTYAFRTGDGTDTIKDFNAAEGDKINLSGTIFTSLADLQNQGRITQAGPNTIIALGSGLVLEHVDATTLTAAQFVFNGPTDINLSPASVEENSLVGTVVGALAATDVDANDTFTFQLVDNPGGLFSIDGANLVVAGSLDYETAQSHDITVKVTDSTGNIFGKLITVNVLDVNVTANPDSYSTKEDTTLTVPAAGVLANDTDDNGNSLSASLVSGPGHGTLTLNANGSFTYKPVLNYNGPDSFTYKANDTTTPDSDSATVSITVDSVNDAPVIQSGGGGGAATYFVKVNNTAITTVVATDVDSGDVASFSIVPGADSSKFSIDQNTGSLAFSSPPNVPNKSYLVQVQASDGHGGTDLQDIVVNVAGDKMIGGHTVPETFVFHSKFGANTIYNFDKEHDFLQFDKGLFSADNATTVLAAAHNTTKGVVIDLQAGYLAIIGVTKGDLAAHASDIVFV